MKYDFDKIIERKGTASVKYDLVEELYGREDLLPMWVADMDFETPYFIREAIAERLAHPVLGYGIRPQSFFEAVALWLDKRHNWKVDPREISFSPGVVTGLYLAQKAFSQNGDAVVVQPPVYFPFFITVNKNKRKLVYNQLIENEGYYKMDFDDLELKLKDVSTKMIFISNPHNPVGRAWKKDELERLVELCYESNTLIISDEIHSDLILKPHKHIPVASLSEKAAEITLTLMAPSKTFNMAGLSTSVVIAKNPRLLKKYNEMLEATHTGQGNVFGTVAAEAAYRCGASWLDELMDYIGGNVDFVSDFIKENLPGIKMQKTEATYLLWLDVRALGMNSKQLKELFVNKAGLALNYGEIFGPGGKGFVRMNVGAPRKLIVEAMERIGRVV